jgi:hypothetical protein
VAPCVHRKREPIQVDGSPVPMTVVEDPYGFDADIGNKLESILQDQKRLRSLEPRPYVE